MKKLLVACCCAPCSVAPLEYLSDRFDLTLFWYNPNIHPFREYKKRLNSFLDFADKVSAKTIVKDEYDLQKFLQAITFRESSRCEICYYIRLKHAFTIAKNGGYDLLTSTLLYSKSQNHTQIVQTSKAHQKSLALSFSTTISGSFGGRG